MDVWNYVLNQKYVIQYRENNVCIYGINSDNKCNLIIKFETKAQINSIQFNPLINNIIIISFNDGTCKIYNILKKSDKEDILFECVKKENIRLCRFNIYNPNIILTLTAKNNLYIWDVRKLYYLNLINLKEEKLNIKWSHYDSDDLETINDDNQIRLINPIKQIVKVKKKLEKRPINYLFLKGDFLIVITEEKIEKFEKDKIINTKNFEKITESNEDLIKDNNILIIISKNYIFYFFDILSFSTIGQICIGFPKCYFCYIKSDNEIGLKYIYKSISYALEENIVTVNNKILEKNKNESLDNIKNDFYENYCPKILKYMCLLNFNENIYEEPNYKMKYMNINEIKKYFCQIKDINIFDRKDFVTQVLDYNIDCNKIIHLNKELKVEKFENIRKLIEIFKIIDIKDRKQTFIEKIRNKFNNNVILDYYKEIIKLLSIDNTNVKLLEIYLLLLQLYEKDLIINFGEDNIEKYDDEVKYYSVCFSKENYKELFNFDKTSEKELLLNFLNTINQFDNFNYDNIKFKNYLLEFKKNSKKFPDFNQPIEFDCDNNELKWFNAKIHVFASFLELKLIKDNEELLINLREVIKKVMEKQLFENEDIIGNKYMFQSVVYLITNPCSTLNDDKSLDFFCNSLLSKRNKKEELEGKFIINEKHQLEYEHKIYDNFEDICIDNLSFSDFKNEEKYNFNYLLNNYVKNEDKIKQFLNNILQKNVFIEVYKILFGNDNYKIKYKRYLDEFVNKRLAFVPIRPNRVSAISDKISLNTFISTQHSELILKGSKIINAKNLKELLNTAKYIFNEEHEIFHLINCIPYYENNCLISINTPRKEKYEGESEGGIYLELLLFNKEIKSITLADALFLLNEKNYDKSLYDFIDSFENKKHEDLIIEGVFNDFNNYFDVKQMTIEELSNYYIRQKSNDISESVLDSYISIELKNDIAGKFHYENI